MNAITLLPFAVYSNTFPLLSLSLIYSELHLDPIIYLYVQCMRILESNENLFIS